MAKQPSDRDERTGAAARRETAFGEMNQVVGEVGARDVVDLRASALGQEAECTCEVSRVGLERVFREPALDLDVVEKQVDGFVEPKASRHRPMEAVLAGSRNFSSLAVTPPAGHSQGKNAPRQICPPLKFVGS